jgi:hypothetical protein
MAAGAVVASDGKNTFRGEDLTAATAETAAMS